MSALIEIREVSKIYQVGEQEVVALRGVSLDIVQGEMIAFMGSSGSGKSTLMNILGCLDRPTHGSYVLDGRQVAHLSKNELADVRNQTLGFVFQSFNLLARTSALENVELPLVYRGTARKERLLRARASLEAVNLGARLDHTPSQLSGGQQQRVAIARALVTEPRIVLADEPTGNLDSKTSVEIMALFQALETQGITVILVTHEPDVAAYAKRVVTLKDGVVVTDVRQRPAPAAELVSNLGELS